LLPWQYHVFHNIFFHHRCGDFKWHVGRDW
jgi:hypothetical protein